MPRYLHSNSFRNTFPNHVPYNSPSQIMEELLHQFCIVECFLPRITEVFQSSTVPDKDIGTRRIFFIPKCLLSKNYLIQFT